MKILVIGGGQASFSFIQKLRDMGNSSHITLLCGEDHYPYQRPPLSKKYLSAGIPPEKLYFRDSQWYEKQAIEVKLNEQAQHIDVNNKTVTTASGSTFSYDILFLGLGGKARALPSSLMDGLREGVHSVRGIDDVERLKNSLESSNHVLIIGGGYLGLELASSIRMFGREVSVIEAGSRILGRVACKETSNFLRSLHQNNGVHIQENVNVALLDRTPEGRFNGIRTEDGKRFSADLLLVAIGMVALDKLAASSGIACDNGILVNSFGKTNIDDIYAAGDATRFHYKGEWVNFESVYQAKMMAELAAENVNGTTGKTNEPMPWFWTDQYNVKVQMAGYGSDYDDVWVRQGKREGQYSHWYFREGMLIRVDSLGDVEGYQVGKILLENGIALSRADLEASNNIREFLK